MNISPPILVGDIGGTNARFGLADPVTFAVSHTGHRRTADFDGIEAAIRSYLALEGAHASPKMASIAVACPVNADEIRFTNNHWRFSKSLLKADFAFDELQIINDFTAQALAVPHLPPHHVVQIGASIAPASESAIAVLGPGTGLGVSGLLPSRAGWVAVSGEGGHVGVTAENEQEIEILRLAWKEYGRTSLERFLCGAGIAFLYKSLGTIHGVTTEPLEPARIVEQALAGEPVAHATLQQFCAFLGCFAGDVALILGARGGVYIAGGIIPRFVDFFAASPFRERFENKGRFRDYTTTIPSFVVTPDENPALIGAASVFVR